MGSVFSTLTVDGILEKVFCQYTHENFDSTPIVELIFEFAVTINGFYCYRNRINKLVWQRIIVN